MSECKWKFKDKNLCDIQRVPATGNQIFSLFFIIRQIFMVYFEWFRKRYVMKKKDFFLGNFFIDFFKVIGIFYSIRMYFFYIVPCSG